MNNDLEKEKMWLIIVIISLESILETNELIEVTKEHR